MLLYLNQYILHDHRYFNQLESLLTRKIKQTKRILWGIFFVKCNKPNTDLIKCQRVMWRLTSRCTLPLPGRCRPFHWTHISWRNHGTTWCCGGPHRCPCSRSKAVVSSPPPVLSCPSALPLKTKYNWYRYYILIYLNKRDLIGH